MALTGKFAKELWSLENRYKEGKLGRRSLLYSDSSLEKETLINRVMGNSMREFTQSGSDEGTTFTRSEFEITIRRLEEAINRMVDNKKIDVTFNVSDWS